MTALTNLTPEELEAEIDKTSDLLECYTPAARTTASYLAHHQRMLKLLGELEARRVRATGGR